MSRRLLLLFALALLLVYLLLGEVAWRSDFMAALAGVRRGRPLLCLLEVCFFAFRVVLVVAGPSLVAALCVHHLWNRLTRS